MVFAILFIGSPTELYLTGGVGAVIFGGGILSSDGRLLELRGGRPPRPPLLDPTLATYTGEHFCSSISF